MSAVTPHPRTRILARYQAWDDVGTRHGNAGRWNRAAAAAAIARRLARAYRADARADLEASGAIVDVARW